jgi:catechol 2,3-dioxygenase-like lactoylglutathione lyase family enzyme
MLKRLDHINIVVTDLSRAKEFFLNLGFEEGDSSTLSGEWISAIVGLEGVDAAYVSLHLPGSETAIELLEYRHPYSNRDPDMGKANQLGFRHLAFAVSDIEATVRKLRQMDVEFLSDIQTYEKTGKRLVYFYGPDGILLELAQYKSEEM